MQKISSTTTYYYKRVFPAVWFGGLSIFIIIGLLSMPIDGRHIGEDTTGLLLLIVMAVFGYFLIKYLVFDLVDEAWDDGDSLLLRNGNLEARVPLSNISNVNYSVATNPPKVTLSLREPCALGKEVSFMPPISVIPFKKSPSILHLIERIDEARRR
jgi:hypothetical protein